MAIHLLAIGNNYQGTDNELPDCELDARRALLQLDSFCKSSQLLTGAAATRAGILAAGRKMKARLAAHDLWIIYNSGHGTQLRQKGRLVEAVVCDGFELIYDYEMDDLIDVGRPPSSRVLAISDSCFSGGLERVFAPGRLLVRSIPAGRCRQHAASPPPKDRLLPGVIFMSGCRTNETSSSTGQGGALSNALWAALAKLGPGASFAKLFDLVGGKHGALPCPDYPQHPQLVGEPADLKLSLQSFVTRRGAK